MAGLARLCRRRKNLVLIAWIAMLAALGGLVGMKGSAFSDTSRLPASDSSTAYNLLARAGSDAAKVTTGTIVWDTRSGSALSQAASSRIAPMLASVAKVEGVQGVISPFTAAGAKQVSADSRTAYATVLFTSDSHEAAAQKLAQAAAISQLDVQVGGAAFTPALLATMGRRVLRKSERGVTGSPAPACAGPVPAAVPARPGVWARWARLVERRPVVAGVLSVAVLAGLAAPALAVRLGAADASSAPAGTSARSFYDTMADAFGKGFDAQLLLVAQTPDNLARTAWTTLATELPEVKGVASVGTPAAVSGNSLSTIQVVPPRLRRTRRPATWSARCAQASSRGPRPEPTCGCTSAEPPPPTSTSPTR